MRHVWTLDDLEKETGVDPRGYRWWKDIMLLLRGKVDLATAATILELCELGTDETMAAMRGPDL